MKSGRPHDKDIACIQCHTEPGPSGYIKIFTKTIKNVVFEATGRDQPIVANVSDSSCERCHHEQPSGSYGSGDGSDRSERSH